MDPRPLVFLSLNDRLDEEACRLQVRKLAALGWGGFYMHTRWGMAEAFLGDRYMRAIRAMVEEARACGLKAWLYDEDRWPSGSGGGLAGLDARLRQRVLVRRPADWTPWGNETVVHRDASATFVEHVMAADSPGAPGGTIGDLLNPATTARLIETAYEPYARAVGDEFGRTVPGIFMDEPELIGHFQVPAPALPWTTGMEALYRARWGEELAPLLAALYADRAESPRARWRFRRLVEERFAESFFRPLHAWCSARGLEFVGHLTCEESLSSIVNWAGISSAAHPWFHVPGVDMLGRKIDEHPTLKTAVGAARQLGRPVQSELFGLAGAGATPEDLRWIADWHLACGVTRFCVHLAHHSLRGARKHECLPSIHAHQPWAPAIPALAERLGALGRLLDEGADGCELALLHPMDSAWLCTIPIPDREHLFDHHPPAIRPLQESYLACLEAVLGAPRDLDCLSEPLLHGPGAPPHRIEGGRLLVGRAAYRAVILPRLDSLRRETLALLLEAGAAGVALFAAGPLPQRIDGDLPDAAGRQALERLAALVETTAPADLAAALRRRVPAACAIDGSDARGWLRCHERLLPTGRRIFLHHGDRRRGCQVRLTVGTASCRLVDAVPGERSVLTAADGTLILDLPPGGAALIEIGCAEQATGAAGEARRLALAQPATGEALDDAGWRGRRFADNALVLPRCRWRRDGGAWQPEIAVRALQRRLTAEDWRGRLELAVAFTSHLPPGQRLRLLVEDAGRWQVELNGGRLLWQGETWLDPAFTLLDAGAALRPGANELRLACDWSAARVESPAHMPRHPGIDLEALTLLGDFALDTGEVRRPPAHRDWDCLGLPAYEGLDAVVRPALLPPRPFALGDAVLAGMPHFAGTLCFERDLAWAGGPARFSLDRVAGGVVGLAVDGVDRGLLPWGPWTWELGALPAGTHRFTLTLQSTLRNLLGSQDTDFGDGVICFHASHDFVTRPEAGRGGGLPVLGEGRVRLDPLLVGGARLGPPGMGQAGPGTCATAV